MAFWNRVKPDLDTHTDELLYTLFNSLTNNPDQWTVTSKVERYTPNQIELKNVAHNCISIILTKVSGLTSGHIWYTITVFDDDPDGVSYDDRKVKGTVNSELFDSVKYEIINTYNDKAQQEKESKNITVQNVKNRILKVLKRPIQKV